MATGLILYYRFLDLVFTHHQHIVLNVQSKQSAVNQQDTFPYRWHQQLSVVWKTIIPLVLIHQGLSSPDLDNRIPFIKSQPRTRTC